MRLFTSSFAIAIGMTAWNPIHAQMVDTAATKSSLLAADATLAKQLGSEGPEALIRLLDPNAAVLMPEQPILRGAKASPALIARYSKPTQYRWIAKHAVAGIDGKFGCTVGIIRFIDGADTLHKERGGVYETCWMRNDARASWTIVGLQSQDDTRPGKNLLYLAGVPMTRTPHSATVAITANPLAEALDQDTRFASMAAGIDGAGPAFVKFAAADAISLIAPDSARGTEEIGRLFGGMGGLLALLWNPDRSFGAASGGLAFTVGRSVRIPLKGQKIPERHGKFLTIWRENADGTWSWIFDLGSLRRWLPN